MDGRQFEADQAVNHRAEFETVLQLQKLPMKVGDIVLSHGNLSVLKSIGENDNCGAEGPSCVFTFSAGDITQEYSYRCVFGKGDGSASLQRPPPTLMLSRRIIIKNVVTAQTRKLVKVHTYEVCPESPYKRDEMRKHVGPRVWVIKQALILPCTKETLKAKFNDRQPNLLSSSQYDEVLAEEVWNLKQAYRETCLCRTCFNCRLYREAMGVVS